MTSAQVDKFWNFILRISEFTMKVIMMTLLIQMICDCYRRVLTMSVWNFLQEDLLGKAQIEVQWQYNKGQAPGFYIEIINEAD